MVAPPSRLFKPQEAPFPICSFNSNGWYCVTTPTFLTPELAQLLKAKSLIRYFPPKGTAGLAIFFVRTPNRVPCPPAKITAIISCFLIQLDRNSTRLNSTHDSLSYAVFCLQ